MMVMFWPDVFSFLTCADTNSKHIRKFLENPGVAVLTPLRRFKHVIVVAAMFLAVFIGVPETCAGVPKVFLFWYL
jgi:hypothetical protein